jgi:hypothetical protein
MTDQGMTYEQALDVLKRMHQAAPNLAKSKLEGVIGLLETLHDTAPTTADSDPLPPPARPRIAPLRPSSATDTSRQRTVEVERVTQPPPMMDAPSAPSTPRAENESQDSRSFSRLLGRLQSQTMPRAPAAPPPAPPSNTVDYIFQDFDLDQYSIENMPDPSDSRLSFTDMLPEWEGTNAVPRPTHDPALSVPGTGDLFGDLPEFRPDTPLDPKAFHVDAVLGIEGGATQRLDDQPPTPVDLLAVLGLGATGMLPPVPDSAEFFDDLASSAGVTPVWGGEAIPDDVGMENVTDLLREADALDSDAHGTWRVTDVLRDLGASNTPIPTGSPRRMTTRPPDEIESSFDLSALIAESDAGSGAPFGGTAMLPETADDLSSPSAWGVTTIFPNSDQPVNDLSGATAMIGGHTAALPDDPSSGWGATAMIGGHTAALPDDPSSGWGATGMIGNAPDMPIDDVSQRWGATALFPDGSTGAPTADHDADDMPSSRLWNADASYAKFSADAPPLGVDPDEMPSSRLWSADASYAAMPAAWSAPDSDAPAWKWGTDSLSDGEAVTHAAPPEDIPTEEAPLDDLRAPYDAWMVENGLVDRPPTADATRARWNEPPAWLVEAPLQDGELSASYSGESAPDPTVPARNDGDLPHPAALLTNVRDVLKPSLLLLRAQTALMRDRVDETLDERDSEMVRLMQDNAEMALTLLESLEIIMQLREGALAVQWDEFSCIDLLREAGERMQDRARAYKHRITVQLDRGLPRLRGDYKRTLAILVDLMDNAVRYSPEGATSRVAVDHLGGWVLFTVADSGIGLNEQEQAYIGQPFWRALHQPLVRAHRGTGLRLYLARRVLALQDGELFFSGEAGRGSTFSFTVATVG